MVELFYIGMPVVWTVGRAYGHVITKIFRMGRLPNFLTHGAPLRARGAALIFLQHRQAKTEGFSKPFLLQLDEQARSSACE